MSVGWGDRLAMAWVVRVEEVLNGLFVPHLIVDIGAAQRGGCHVGSGVLAPVPSGIIPLPVEGGGSRGWGRGVARLGEAVAAGDTGDAGLVLGGIVDHICELGLE